MDTFQTQEDSEATKTRKITMIHQNEETPLHVFKRRWDLVNALECEKCGLLKEVDSNEPNTHCNPEKELTHV